MRNVRKQSKRISVHMEREQTERISVYMKDVEEDDVNEIAGMLRGLACALDGFEGVAGMKNEKFWREKPVKWKFSSVDKANYFKECVEYYFSDEVLDAMRVKRRYRKR